MNDEDFNKRLGYQARAKARKRGELVGPVLEPEEPPRKAVKLLESEKPTTILIKDMDDY